ncbi:Wnt inhibitory factor 1-like, partial [Homarus americanus]
IDASVHCFTGYLLVTGECSVLLECEGGVWVHPALLHQGCVPQCSMSCRNGGVCRGPDFCECSEGYYGRECELVQCQGPVPTVEDGYVGFCQKGMTAKCAEGYGFSGGDREVSLICRNETWALPPEVEQDPACRPKCQHRCNNRGTCVAPDYCRCEEGYGGSDCSGVSCDVIPKELFNWYISLSKTQLTAECPQNAKFSRGESKLSFICVDNTWQYPTSYQHGESLKCVHSCVPPCENGGTCEVHNTCRCRTGFIGRRCEKIKCEGPLPYVKDAVFSFIGDSVLVNCITNFDNKIRGSYWIHCIEGHWNLDSSLGPISSASACSKNEGQRLASGKLESREGFVGEKELAVSVCEGPPPMVHYADIVYSNSEVRVIKCQSDYVLDNDKTSTQVVSGSSFGGGDVLFSQCPGGCLNGGTCTAPNTCNCPDDTYGSRCEKRSLCVAPPDPPPHMRLVWTKSGYVGVCQTGYAFANPLQSDLLIICVNGSWRKSNLVPCVLKCQVLCINGGTCLAPNTCSCRQGFSGALCRLLVLGNCCHDNTWVTPRGWSWDREACQPFCDPECQGGGVCERPEQCRCPNGIYSPNCSPDTRTGCHGTPMVVNATAVKIADHLSRVTCRIGHASSSGAKVFLMRCLNGHWVTIGSIAFPSTRVACYHQCQPRCLHGGQCYGPNR